MKTPQDLVAEAKQNIREVNVNEARDLLAQGKTFIDVREPAEWDNGTIGNAIKIPRGLLEFRINEHDTLTDRDQTLVVYCAGGGRSALAAQTLKSLGYENAVSLAGGYKAWSESS